MQKITLARKAYFSSGYSSEVSDLGHGANFVMEAFVEGFKDQTGLVINLTDLDQSMKNVVKTLDHKNLSMDLNLFAGKSFQLEKLAQYCFDELHKEVKELLQENTISLKKVRLYQGTESYCDILA